MCENVNLKCACDEGYDKGVLKKTIENNVFTIFGNIQQNSSIVVRYHGILLETLNQEDTLNIFYYFDSNIQTKKNVKLQKCTKCIGENYCVTINLENFTKLHFGFESTNNMCDINQNKPYELEISPDPISNIMQRYGFEKNASLPVLEEEKTTILQSFKRILNNIKYLLKREKQHKI